MKAGFGLPRELRERHRDGAVRGGGPSGIPCGQFRFPLASRALRCVLPLRYSALLESRLRCGEGRGKAQEAEGGQRAEEGMFGLPRELRGRHRDGAVRGGGPSGQFQRCVVARRSGDG